MAKRLRRPLSLKWRVMLFVAGAVSLSLIVIGYLVQHSVKQHFKEQDADELLVITAAVTEALRSCVNQGLPFDERLSRAVSGHHGVYFQVWDDENRLIYRQSELEFPAELERVSPLARIHADNLHHWYIAGETFRGGITWADISGKKFKIAAAINMDFHIQFLRSFRRNLWLIMALAGTITLIAASYGVHQGHAPLRVLSEGMRDIQADQLYRRLDSDVMPSELQPLVDSFNHMLSRLEDSFTRLRHFSADIAHELRTPLTNLATQTQVGLGQARTLDEYRELLYSNLEEQERLTKMVNDMLWLAQSENGLLQPNLEQLDLQQEVTLTFEFFEALAEEKGVRLWVTGRSAKVLADRAMFRRVISNLLSNALRYTAPGESIKVATGQADDAVFLTVENPGPEIAAEHLPKLFDRFYQVDPSRQRQSEGAGLGLAIVRSIVEAHMGTIGVISQKHKTQFRVTLPTGQ